MNEYASHQYNNEEVARIIQRALKLKQADTISHEDLIEIAREVGIDPKILDTVVAQEQREYQKERRLKSRMKRRWVGFYSHLSSYLTVNAVLLVINALIPGPWWVQWSLLGWGIGVVSHFKAIHRPDPMQRERHMKLRHGRAVPRMCATRR